MLGVYIHTSQWAPVSRMHRSSSQPCGDIASCPSRLAQLEVSPSPNKPAIPETSVIHQQASSSHRTPQTLKTATHGLSYSHQQVTPVPEQLPWDLVLLTSRLALDLRTAGPSASPLVPTMGMWILKPATQGLGPTNNRLELATGLSRLYSQQFQNLDLHTSGRQPPVEAGSDSELV